MSTGVAPVDTASIKKIRESGSVLPSGSPTAKSLPAVQWSGMTSSHAEAGSGNGSPLPLAAGGPADGPLRLAPGAHDDTITVTVTY
ncbi:MAG: hypothetical protein ABSG00_03855 [Terracidiphilus sp.]